LLYAAKKAGCDVQAYFIKSPFQPEFELYDALRLAEVLNVTIKVETFDSLLDNHVVAENPAHRCYHCKRALFSLLWKRCGADGYDILCDGTNASDEEGDRPGMKALRELNVRSPLRECGLTKSEIRRLSKEGGLFTHDKPAYACLATRIPTGIPITLSLLQKVEHAENALFEMGFSDFRVRYFAGAAKLQFPENQYTEVLRNREKIVQVLESDFHSVLLDLIPR
ncbi:MAG: ATP-dependent sacrificial sulfur transferase LarE, partial [Clostridiales bacterium]|nr:ATP-dependent sacrificial sulfur transferase LarE [Clostridiales bacterium]